MGIGTGWDGECQIHPMVDGQGQPRGCACKNIITPQVSPAPQRLFQSGSKQEAKLQVGKHSSRTQHISTTMWGEEKLLESPQNAPLAPGVSASD